MISTRRLAWVTLVWNVGVILLGALVRATGSGAGCGNSWPTCDGVILPELAGATAIEFTHRATSGIALVLIGWLAIRVFRTHHRGSSVRKAAIVASIGVLSESLIGAFIVLADLVADNASVARTVSVPIHLANTFVLLAGLMLTVFWLDREARLSFQKPGRVAIVGFGLGMVAIAATGAVTALADTLYPAQSLAEGLAEDLAATSESLTRLRVIHPVIATLVGLAAARWTLAQSFERGDPAFAASRVVVLVVFLQLIVGVVNIWTLTPIAIQLIHLALADTIWLAWVWMGASLLTVEAKLPVTAE